VEVAAVEAKDELVAAALEWARLDVPVLPVRPAEKAPLTVHGVSDASTDIDVVRAWWTRWPEANVAIATGGRGVDVLDVDVRGAGSGWAALNRLRQAGIVQDGIPLVRTPSGGIHLYFLGPDQGNGSLHREHVDFRSSGGYVLVPPSRVVTDAYAGVYRWERRAAPTTRLDWQAVREFLRPTPAIPPPRATPIDGRNVTALARAVERTEPGNRNNMLFWALCEALRSGYDLRPIVQAGLRCGQTAREVQATWRQAVARVSRDGQMPSPPSRTSSLRRATEAPVNGRVIGVKGFLSARRSTVPVVGDRGRRRR
jgi:Bifunctional DNA primase/polymerase, N-terminal